MHGVIYPTGCRERIWLKSDSLIEAMNQMAGQLEDRLNTIVSQRNEMAAVLSSMAEGVIAVDMDEQIISINKAAARIFENLLRKPIKPKYSRKSSEIRIFRSLSTKRFPAKKIWKRTLHFTKKGSEFFIFTTHLWKILIVNEVRAFWWC